MDFDVSDTALIAKNYFKKRLDEQRAFFLISRLTEENIYEPQEL
jgi:hypothetical protein